MGQQQCCASAEKLFCYKEQEVDDQVLQPAHQVFETLSDEKFKDQQHLYLVKEQKGYLISDANYPFKDQEEPQFSSVPPPAPAVEAVSAIEAPKILQEFASSEPTSTPASSPRSPRTGKSKSDKKKAMKAMVSEFLAVAKSDSGIPCKVYHYNKERASFMLSSAKMYMSLDASTIKLSLDYSEQLRELPLISTRVYDYGQLKSPLFDSDIVKALLHEDPCEYMHLSIILVTPEETLCVVLPDQAMMHKSKKSLTILSEFSRESLKKTKSEPSEGSTTAGSSGI